MKIVHVKKVSNFQKKAFSASYYYVACSGTKKTVDELNPAVKTHELQADCPQCNINRTISKKFICANFPLTPCLTNYAHSALLRFDLK